MKSALSHSQRKLLESLLSPARLHRLREVLANRLGCLTLILDNLYDPHNMAAIVRTVESMGIQDIHIVHHRYPFAPSSSITRHSHKWISMHRYDDISECYESLRKAGFRIYTAEMGQDSRTVHQLPLRSRQPIALVMGNEHEGISPQSRELADGTVHIPMYGFTESFNVSVAAALLLQQAVTRRRQFLSPACGSLPETRIRSLYDDWLRKSVKNSSRILKEHGRGIPR